MTLKDCTKEELIYIIKHLTHFDISNFHLNQALNDVRYERERKKFDEADKLNKIWAENTRKYCEVLKPYEGMRIIDIPREVIEKAEEYRKAADEANKKYEKIMNILKKWE